MIYNLIETKKSKRIRNNPDKHIPNKLESKLLRKLMSENSLSEEEIRSNIKFRRMLAKAGKSGESIQGSRVRKWYYKIIKNACRKTKLAPQHPKTIETLQKMLNNYSHFNTPWYILNINNNAKSVVESYSK